MLSATESPHVMVKSRISPKIGENNLRPQAAWSVMDGKKNKISSQPLISEADSAVSSVEESVTERSDCENLTKRSEPRGSAAKDPYRWRVPYTTLVNVLIQVLAFCYVKGDLFSALLYSPRKKYEAWRFLTYSILHTDVVHLVLNLFLQVIVAFLLESEQGHLKVLLVFLGGALAGSLGTSVFQPTLLMVGSSAGVYSLLISHIPHLIMNFSYLPYRYYRIISVIVLCLSDIIFATVHCLQSGNMQPKISLAAHICGALSGFLLGFMLYSSRSSKLTFTSLKFLSIFLYVTWIIVAIVINKNMIIL